MKKYFMLFLLFLIFGAAKAQVSNDITGHYYNFTDLDDTQGAMSNTSGVPSAGEYSTTDGFGTTVDVSWSIVDSTLSWNVDVDASAGGYLHLHRLWITDDMYSTTSIVDDDFEDGSALGFGCDYWHSSGSTNLGNSPRTLFFSFENFVTDEPYEQSAGQQIMGNIYYLEP